MNEALALPTWRDEEWRYADFDALATLAPDRFGEWKEIALAPGETRRKCLILDGAGPELHRARLRRRSGARGPSCSRSMRVAITPGSKSRCAWPGARISSSAG